MKHETHGMNATKEYEAWRSMRQRCTNPNVKQWKDYGGRGITVCKEWLESFTTFFKYIGKCPKGKSIDRYPNNDGNYEPGNVRWATQQEQADNRRPKATKTHCPQGHEYTEVNTYVTTKGSKVCRVCNAETSRLWYISSNQKEKRRK
jgi:hypothetical protein